MKNILLGFGLVMVLLIGGTMLFGGRPGAPPASARPTVNPALPLSARLDVLWARSDWDGVIAALVAARNTPEWDEALAEKLQVAETNRSAVQTAVVARGTATAEAGRPAPAVGEKGHLRGGSARVMVATTEANFDEMIRLSVAGDTLGLTQLALAGRAFLVVDGTRILVIDSGLGKRRVRILEGPLLGRDGWVPYEWTRPE